MFSRTLLSSTKNRLYYGRGNLILIFFNLPPGGAVTALLGASVTAVGEVTIAVTGGAVATGAFVAGAPLAGGTVVAFGANAGPVVTFGAGGACVTDGIVVGAGATVVTF